MAYGDLVYSADGHLVYGAGGHLVYSTKKTFESPQYRYRKIGGSYGEFASCPWVQCPSVHYGTTGAYRGTGIRVFESPQTNFVTVTHLNICGYYASAGLRGKRLGSLVVRALVWAPAFCVVYTTDSFWPESNSLSWITEGIRFELTGGAPQVCDLTADGATFVAKKYVVLKYWPKAEYTVDGTLQALDAPIAFSIVGEED
jgi:hypothetical protein